MVEVFTSRWQNQELAHLDLVPVGISRGVPRFPVRYRYRRLPDLYPDGWMLSIEDDARFEKVYVKKLDRLGVDEIATRLLKISQEEGGKPLVLLCFEADPKDCHRRMVARFWHDKTGEVVEELQSCGASHNPPNLQEPLF